MRCITLLLLSAVAFTYPRSGGLVARGSTTYRVNVSNSMSHNILVSYAPSDSEAVSHPLGSVGPSDSQIFNITTGGEPTVTLSAAGEDGTPMGSTKVSLKADSVTSVQF